MAMILPQKQKGREDKSFAQLMKEVAAQSIGNVVGQGIGFLGDTAKDAMKQSRLDEQNTAKFDILRNDAMGKEIGRPGGSGGGVLSDLGVMKDLNLIGTPPAPPAGPAVPDALVASRQKPTVDETFLRAPVKPRAMQSLVNARLGAQVPSKPAGGMMDAQPGPIGLKALPEAQNPRLFRKVVDERKTFTDPTVQAKSLGMVKDQIEKNQPLIDMAMPTQRSMESLTGNNADALQRIALARMTPEQKARAYEVMGDLRGAAPNLANATTASRTSIGNLGRGGDALAGAALEGGKTMVDTRQEFGEYRRPIGGGGGGGGAGKKPDVNIPEAHKDFRVIQDELDDKVTKLQNMPLEITLPTGATMENPERKILEIRIAELRKQSADVNTAVKADQGYAFGGSGLSVPKGLAAGAVAEAKQPTTMEVERYRARVAQQKDILRNEFKTNDPVRISLAIKAWQATTPMSTADAEERKIQIQALQEMLDGR